MLKIANLHVYMIHLIIEKCSDGEMFGLGHFLFRTEKCSDISFCPKVYWSEDFCDLRSSNTVSLSKPMPVHPMITLDPTFCNSASPVISR